MLLNERGGEGARKFQPLWDGKQVPLNCLIILLPLTVLIKPSLASLNIFTHNPVKQSKTGELQLQT